VAQTYPCVYWGHFKQLVWLKGTHVLTFNFTILWALKVNRYYCIKYVRFLLFLIFCISQGSVTTCLRCDGKYNTGLAGNVLPSPTVKWQHLPELFVRLEWNVFWLTVYIRMVKKSRTRVGVGRPEPVLTSYTCSTVVRTLYMVVSYRIAQTLCSVPGIARAID